MRKRSFRAFLKSGNAAAVGALELDILSFGDLRPLDWPQLPSLRHLVVRCPPFFSCHTMQHALQWHSTAQTPCHAPYVRKGILVHIAGDVASLANRVGL